MRSGDPAATGSRAAPRQRACGAGPDQGLGGVGQDDPLARSHDLLHRHSVEAQDPFEEGVRLRGERGAGSREVLAGRFVRPARRGGLRQRRTASSPPRFSPLPPTAGGPSRPRPAQAEEERALHPHDAADHHDQGGAPVPVGMVGARHARLRREKRAGRQRRQVESVRARPPRAMAARGPWVPHQARREGQEQREEEPDRPAGVHVRNLARAPAAAG